MPCQVTWYSEGFASKQKIRLKNDGLKLQQDYREWKNHYSTCPCLDDWGDYTQFRAKHLAASLSPDLQLMTGPEYLFYYSGAKGPFSSMHFK